MAFLQTNYSDLGNTEYGPLPEGNYEVVIQSATEKETKNGKQALALDLVVRNDLKAVPELASTNGKYANRHIFNDFWKRNINGVYAYDTSHFQYLLDAINVPEGTPIQTFEIFLGMLQGKPVNVFVTVEDNTYNGTTTQINRIAPWGFGKSNFPNVMHTFNKKDEQSATAGNGSPFTEDGRPIDISEDDLPF